MGLFRNKRSFDAEVRRQIAAAAKPGTVIKEIDNDTVQIGSVIVGLSNLRAKWNRLDVEERRPWLSETVQALVSPPALPSQLETTTPLRPGIRPRSMLESARLANLQNEVRSSEGRNRPLIPFQPFGGDLVSVLLWDAPTTMSVVNQLQLDEWDATFDDLLEIAVKNLAAEPDLGWTTQDTRVYTSMNEDDYDGARMLGGDYLEQTGLDGELVVIHPNRNLLIVTAVDDTRGIHTACGLALEDLAAPSPVSFQPLVGRGSDWRPLVLPPSHPAHPEWQRLTAINHEMNYSSLREPLQQLVSDDLTVVPYRVGEASDGSYLSCCTWKAGVPSLLPKTDAIELISAGNELVRADWNTVQRLVGTMMEPTDHYPELWRVMSFPSNDELSELRDRSSNA